MGQPRERESERPAATRRRGDALEAAILEAAWAELAETGYPQLTMEGVAARARTGKQVLYRRWRNRAELVIAAMRHSTGSIADDIPDTGSLREDVLTVLRRMAARQEQIGADVIHGLMAEAVDIGPEFPALMHDVLLAVLRQAERRGDIPAADRSPRVVNLPADLTRHEMLMTRRPVPDRVLTAIVDEVFLPLLTAAPHPAG
ncbi:TetR/AcrR family transcriptional regulator [Actinacidiphila yeochonensis]|uniref:TetR/AcrR family transcriptional regulator n=1 Tax=Actinacidiphila yeochonensis TaxID=89050 RepID=UPI00056B27F9|nr:TetR/AcrR family transcriptional regulator [Actinacidiphila yeochonensis]